MSLLTGAISWFFTGGSSDISKSVSSVAGAVSNVSIAKERARVDIHRADVDSATTLGVADSKADVGIAELQQKLALADRSDKKTGWMRPAIVGIAVYYIGCLVIMHAQPKLAQLLWIQVTPLPWPFDWLIGSIPVALLGMRPLEKNKRADVVAKSFK